MSRKVNVVFSGDMSRLRRAVTRAQVSIRAFSAKARESIRSVASSMKSIGFSTLKIGAAGATAALGGLLAGAVKGVKLAADMERLSTSFEVLTGSAETARKTIKALDDLSNSTPLAPEEVISAGQQLISFGQSAETVTATVSRLGDVASGIGAPLGDIAEIYGKARVQGTLFAEDLNQLAGRGIPIFDSLAQVMGVSAGEVKKLTSQGRVGFAHLEKSFINMTSSGGKFEGMMKKQSTTFSGLLSTMFGKLRAKLRDVFTPVMQNLKPVLDAIISKIDTMSPKIAEAAGKLGEFVKLAIAAFSQGKIFAIGASMLKIGMMEASNFLWKAIKASVSALTTGLVKSAELAMSLLTDENFGKGVLATFSAAANMIKSAVAELSSAMLGGVDGYDNLAKAYAQSAKLDSDIAASHFGKTNLAPGALELIKSSALAAKKGFSSGEELTDAKAARQKLSDQISSLRKATEDNTLAQEAQASATKKLPASAAQTLAPSESKKSERSQGEKHGSFAHSKARVGGGGRVFAVDNRALSEARRQTSIQKRIADATEEAVRKEPVTSTAVFA